MQGLIKPEQFAARAVGLPWQRWRSDWTSMDCWGLVVLYFREVLAVDLGDVPQTDLMAGYAAAAAGWSDCGPEPGAVWMTWVDGEPTHCGIALPGGMLLHAQETPAGSGSGAVRITRLAAVAHLTPDLRFYRRATC